ncbi:hypothetical protein CC1G_13971 [Coprinopsis cinerea okayama7|uniref:Uncharacterized protein n=1 Tax=Coprinopsis cinerea (strain Okayama-7 / 130 / ATCC MYA-4618 / FGSC 9003) TaxID=240176 RepID=D6RKR0_COPC7|nr:hypothetical protein CC1G_13971 [Coprinopsis cinerea okayama7\|eukprot:XP_002911932.1 hypothetical protein CC1G_13971 [Coprinopsis cinerea okayama7\
MQPRFAPVLTRRQVAERQSNEDKGNAKEIKYVEGNGGNLAKQNTRKKEQEGTGAQEPIGCGVLPDGKIYRRDVSDVTTKEKRGRSRVWGRGEEGVYMQ